MTAASPRAGLVNRLPLLDFAGLAEVSSGELYVRRQASVAMMRSAEEKGREREDWTTRECRESDSSGGRPQPNTAKYSAPASRSEFPYGICA